MNLLLYLFFCFCFVFFFVFLVRGAGGGGGGIRSPTGASSLALMIPAFSKSYLTML